MPVIENSSYKPPFLLGNNHLQTVLPTLFRKVKGVNYVRERIDTPDGDFIDLDISSIGADRTVILSHGLEGKSDRAYMKGMIKAFNIRGWDGVSFNFRGCSGEPNRTSATYHSGKTEDLNSVIQHLISVKKYKTITLAGFSLGANLTLKYAGEMGERIPSEIKSAIGISAPCDLISSSIEIHKRKNIIYAKRFLKTLVDKMKQKEHLHNAGITRDYKSIRTLKDFDDKFTAPLNGFIDAMDYWGKCSSVKFISGTAIPILILNAKDDPILGEECFPYKEAASNRNIFLEVPGKGGHMGFITFSKNGEFWHETRAAEFSGKYA
ncbi:MAG TPA: alpha/beta fold hydrolase [Spirochaetota bacterium]|nr:alpha/beta fold hydrolase [Spirochaetota bacterium]HPS85232.1 alpha/beta fold hydrolase [Spirochaetota bacterium]